ncbi:hypothetical protein HK405_013663 [Cladochytrium tenue]|nr:hypothetical protein HK405_013663 [Cladochytrium tenue]
MPTHNNPDEPPPKPSSVPKPAPATATKVHWWASVRRPLVQAVVLSLVVLVVVAASNVLLAVTSGSLDGARHFHSRLSPSGSIRGNNTNIDAADGIGEDVLPTPFAVISEFDAAVEAELEAHFLRSIYTASQNTSAARGVVMPLYEDIAALGLSLVLRLRAMGVTLPVELPHCGDLSTAFLEAAAEHADELGEVFPYDVCERAEQLRSEARGGAPVFCASRGECEQQYRGFFVKVVAMVFSRFEEVMLVDADTVYFHNVAPLWDTPQYRKTGTLFFHDRISEPELYLGRVMRKFPSRLNELNLYLSTFDVAPLRHLPTLARPAATSANTVAGAKRLSFSPSERLLTSHSWNQRSGHEMDSSLVLWNKRLQPRATTLLGAYGSGRTGVPRPPSYGDKEFFWIASELAETRYAFSDFHVGGSGNTILDRGPNRSIVCGFSAHYFPVATNGSADPLDSPLLYFNTDDILKFRPEEQTLYYSKPRLAGTYAGAFSDRFIPPELGFRQAGDELPQECPFDVTLVALDSEQRRAITFRQELYQKVLSWLSRDD